MGILVIVYSDQGCNFESASYSTIVLYRRDQAGVGIWLTTEYPPKSSLNSPIRRYGSQIDPKHFQQVATEFLKILFNGI